MYERLLAFLRCPECRSELEMEPHEWQGTGAALEVSEGLLRCGAGHAYPVVRGIPRMLRGALEEHRERLPEEVGAALGPASGGHGSPGRTDPGYDLRTRQNFSLEWEHHELGDRTWGMGVDERVKGFFLDPIGIPVEDMDGMVLLDAGCGNGTQSVAYTEYGLEVLALDLSEGLENGQDFRHVRSGARPDRVHFVQADLRFPPLGPASVDIVHSAGVLHHTPNTEQTFRCLSELVRPGGTFYVWLYAYEPVVTPTVNAIRALTTRLPPAAFGKVAQRSAGAFQLFARAVNALGVRSYPRLSRREAALALMDIFGAPYAHYHSFPEVARWYADCGFDDVWPCNPSRRGFGACGRKAQGT